MWLMEQPLLILGSGVILTLLIGGGLVHTGRRSLLWATIGVVLLTAAMLVTERLVVTHAEQVKATLHIIAADLERNDRGAIEEHISSGRPELRAEAAAKMALVEVLDVDIKRNLSVEVTRQRGEVLAQATFNVMLHLRPLRGLVDADGRYPQFLTVRFRLEDGKWRIRSYEMDDPRAGIGR